MLQNLNGLRWNFAGDSTGYFSVPGFTCKAGTVVCLVGAANGTKFEDRLRVGGYSTGANVLGVAAADKLAGETQISVITDQIWPILIDPATTTAALSALFVPTYTVQVNAQGRVVATGGSVIRAYTGENLTCLFMAAANTIVQNAAGDRYLLAQRYGA